MERPWVVCDHFVVIAAMNPCPPVLSLSKDGPGGGDPVPPALAVLRGPEVGFGHQTDQRALEEHSESGGWQLGDLDLSEYPTKYRNRDVIVIIASTGKADEIDGTKYACGIWGFALNELRECPRCRMQVEKTAKGLRVRQQRKRLFREIDQFVEQQWEDED